MISRRTITLLIIIQHLTRRAMYVNIIVRHICATTVAVEKQHYIFHACLYLWYPECNAHHSHLWPVQHYNIFPHLSHKWHV